MSTNKRGLSRKQTQAIEIFLNDKRKSKARAIREAGYGNSIARQPHKVFGSLAVIAELEKRGYDTLGMRVEPQFESAYEIEPAKPPVEIDFNAIPLESLQDLKEKFAAISVPITTVSDTQLLKEMMYVEEHEPNNSSFSSM